MQPLDCSRILLLLVLSASWFLAFDTTAAAGSSMCLPPPSWGLPVAIAGLRHGAVVAFLVSACVHGQCRERSAWLLYFFAFCSDINTTVHGACRVIHRWLILRAWVANNKSCIPMYCSTFCVVVNPWPQQQPPRLEWLQWARSGLETKLHIIECIGVVSGWSCRCVHR